MKWIIKLELILCARADLMDDIMRNYKVYQPPNQNDLVLTLLINKREVINKNQ